MTVSIDSFLVLEKSLSNRLLNSWRRDVAGTTREILELVQAGDFTAAVDICAGLSLAESAEENRRFAEFVGMQAALFGASRLSGDPRRSVFMDEARPEIIKLASNNLIIMLEENATQSVCRLAIEMLNQEQVDQQEATIRSDETRVTKAHNEEHKRFPREFVSAVGKDGKSFIDIGSSLHTSRLASWGFTIEATARGIDSYQVTEQLDGRTCPVCRVMHGRKFSVAQARAKLETWMSVENPDDMKSVAPWPSQSKRNVAALAQMTTSQIQDRGWDTPPYHPLCRGVLVRAGSITVVEPADVTPINVNVLPTEDEQAELTAFQLEQEVAVLARDMVVEALESDKTVTGHMQRLAEELGMRFPDKKMLEPGTDETIVVEQGTLIYNRLKDIKSTKRKIGKQMEKYGITHDQAAERISDSLRYTFIVDPNEYVQDIRDSMNSFRDLGYRNGSFESTWESRPDYKGVNVNLVTPDGVRIEVQFHTPASKNVTSLNHVLYKQWRVLPPDSAEAKELFEQMSNNVSLIETPDFMEFMDDLVQEFNGTA